MSELKVDIISKADGTEREDLCKAWINFNGTGTIAINDSFNVTSITDDGTGLFTITWDTDFASGDYAMGSMTGRSGASTPYFVVIRSSTAGTLLISTHNNAGTLSDIGNISITSWGNQT